MDKITIGDVVYVARYAGKNMYGCSNYIPMRARVTALHDNRGIGTIEMELNNGEVVTYFSTAVYSNIEGCRASIPEISP